MKPLRIVAVAVAVVASALGWSYALGLEDAGSVIGELNIGRRLQKNVAENAEQREARDLESGRLDLERRHGVSLTALPITKRRRIEFMADHGGQALGTISAQEEDRNRWGMLDANLRRLLLEKKYGVSLQDPPADAFVSRSDRVFDVYLGDRKLGRIGVAIDFDAATPIEARQEKHWGELELELARIVPSRRAQSGSFDAGADDEPRRIADWQVKYGVRLEKQLIRCPCRVYAVFQGQQVLGEIRADFVSGQVPFGVLEGQLAALVRAR